MHRTRRRHNQIAVEEPDRRLAAVLHPDARRYGLDNQVHQFLGLGILIARLVPLAVILSTLTEETSRAAAAAASSSASTTAATSTPTPTTTATARAAAIGGIGEIKLRRLDEWRRLHQ